MIFFLKNSRQNTLRKTLWQSIRILVINENTTVNFNLRLGLIT